MSITVNASELAISIKNDTSYDCAELVEFFNANIGSMSALESSVIRNAMDDGVKAMNVDIKRAECRRLIAMDRMEMWRVYATEPTFVGKSIIENEDGTLSIRERTMPLKFKTLEEEYQYSVSTKKDARGVLEPDKTASICRSAYCGKLVMLFNGYMQQTLATDAEAACPVRSKKTDEALDKLELACFKSGSKKNRLAQLQTIFEMILPEGAEAKALSCDITFLKQACAKVKGRNISGIGDGNMMDAIILALGCALSFNAETGKRALVYTCDSKSNYFVKPSKS